MTLRLVAIAPDEDPEALVRGLSPSFGGDEAAPREMVAQTQAMLRAQPRPEPWGSYIAWEPETPVGTCAFKHAPNQAGEVEIAYMTFPLFEGRGHATAMAAQLVEMARAAGADAAIAHTLREENASNRALRRNGFAFGGEVIDPEDGPVWRWEKKLG
jgi:RimJ/RimL family protein N-acetyltransferase